MPKHDAKARRDRYIQIKSWEYESLAFLALTPNEVRVYFEIRGRYNGRNNGSIPLSTREAGTVCHKSNSTGARALERLIALGFLKVRKGYTFDQKRKAREFELTAISMEPAKRRTELPPGAKDFMKLTKKDIKQIDEKLKHSRMDEMYSPIDETSTANVVKFRA